MIFILLVLALVLAAAVWQGVQGMLSSLIMAVCTLLCATLAFTYFEPLAPLLQKAQLPLVLCQPFALMILFLVPLLVIRLLLDTYLPGNVVPPVWVDRVGGGAAGLFTGLLLVGTLAVAVQMLPFSRSVLGYDPYKNDLSKGSGLPIDAPGFTLAMVRTLSSGSMAGRQSFHEVHDDLVLELWATRNRPEGSSMACEEDTLKKVTLFDVTTEQTPEGGTYSARMPQYPDPNMGPDTRVILARVSVGRSAADEDKWLRLMGTHFRLVTGSGESFYPVGYLIYAGRWIPVTGEIGDVRIDRPVEGGDLTLDLIYRIPAESRVGKPSHMVFRRLSRVAATTVEVGLPDPALALSKREVYGDVAIVPPASGAFKSNQAFIAERAEVNADMPFRVSIADRDTTVDMMEQDALARGVVQNSRWAGGVIFGPVDAFESASREKRRVSNFHEPDGQTMVKLVGQAPKSEMGAMANLRLATMQPRVQTDRGESKPAVGGYFTWEENGRKAYAYYEPAPDELAAAAGRQSQGMQEFIKAYNEKRQQVTEVAVLFLVPTDSKVLSFSLAAGAPDLYCEAPLNTGARRR